MKLRLSLRLQFLLLNEKICFSAYYLNHWINRGIPFCQVGYCQSQGLSDELEMVVLMTKSSLRGLKAEFHYAGMSFCRVRSFPPYYECNQKYHLCEHFVSVVVQNLRLESTFIHSNKVEKTFTVMFIPKHHYDWKLC